LYGVKCLKFQELALLGSVW